MSQLTHFEIKLLSYDQEIDFSKLLNKRATLKIWSWQDEDYTRIYHGIISSFEQVSQDPERGDEQSQGQRHAIYRAQLVPLLWQLTLNYQSRIFQEKSVPDVIEEVLKDAGFKSDDYRLSLNGTYNPLVDPPREFCVQYRESDFNFISRLMEEEGMFYYFEYNDDKEAMVIADDPSVHEMTYPMSEIRYEAPTGLQSLEAEYIYPLSYKERVLPSKFLLKDFNYDTPGTNLYSNSRIERGDSTVVYDYPGHFGFLDRGSTLARIRNEESEAERKTLSGRSNCRSLCAGYVFTLMGHDRADLDGDYLLTTVRHYGIQGGPLALGAKTDYANEFQCIPADVPFRPPRVTPKSRVQGTQTATVVGPRGEKLYMDEKGRAKIQFHWDLEGRKNEESSCWVRVSHGYAGPNHGIQFHPLVGDEVIVDFLEADPEKPIIIGRVYNADNMPPLKPENRIQNIIYTPYQHRLLMDDKGTHIVMNTGGNQTLKMTDGSRFRSDYGNNIHLYTSDGHYMHMAEGTEAQGITISTVKENRAVFDDKNKNITIETTRGHMAVFDDDNRNIIIQSSRGHSITIDDKGRSITIIDSNGMHQFKIDIGGRKITVSTNIGSIDMLAPLGSINIKAARINIEAAMTLKMKGGISVTSEAGLQHSTKGTLVSSKASGINTITGALVKIN
jgi:type VI secretion system secreted protein VgrG